MRKLFIPAVLTATLLSSMSAPGDESKPAAATPPARPCSGAEYRQFDFWLGDWEVHDPTGKKVGENRLVAILDSCAIQENWTGNGGVAGTSYNIYDSLDGRWHQMWVDNSGTRLQLAGKWSDGKMVLGGPGPAVAPNGKPVLHRISWQPLGDGRVRQHWQASSDEGKTWSDVFDGLYSRK